MTKLIPYFIFMVLLYIAYRLIDKYIFGKFNRHQKPFEKKVNEGQRYEDTRSKKAEYVEYEEVTD